jgi:predicted metal-dependent phosphoesterase TrpH
MLDLHTHSTASDGTYRPPELVGEAARAGVTHLALTDHDGIGGLAEARAEAENRGVAFLGGVEISAEYGPGTMHILGYGFREDDAAFNAKLAELRGAREERNPKIAQRLRELGMEVTVDDAAAVAGGKVVGRPHFARVLVEKRYVESTQEAFDRFLAKGRPAYVDKVRLGPAQSIAAIRDAGGVAVLAHPNQLKTRDARELEGVVKGLADLGLQGIECFYRDHAEVDEAKFLAIAKTFRLAPTGGSDFHGANRPDIRLGVGEGQMRVPPWCWDRLMEIVRG